MNTAEESTFAWALLDVAVGFLDEQSRVRMYMRIGSGDHRETIFELLGCLASTGTAVPPSLAASLWAWINGFVGSDSETALRNLANRIRVSATVGSPLRIADKSTVSPLVPRRSDIAVRRLALVESSS